MARVTGIGGIFFKSENRESLYRWYRDHLGIEPEAGNGASFSWRDRNDPNRVGQTVWALFEANTDYFEPSSSPFMINFRVENLEQVLDELKAAGVHVIGEIEDYDYGRFGWIMDPEGNKIELWQPLGEEGQSG